MSTLENEILLESLAYRASGEGIWIGGPLHTQIIEDFGEVEAQRMLEQYGCPQRICDGLGWVRDETMEYDSNHDPTGESGERLPCICRSDG